MMKGNLQMELIFSIRITMINLSMKKVKTFIHVFINSLIPQTNYYPKILHTNFFFSLQYYILLLLILSIIFLVSLPFKYSPNKINAELDAVIAGLNQFPDNLKININNGDLITNYDRPYLMWIDYNNQKILLFAVDESDSLPNSDLKPILLLTGQNLQVNLGGNRSSVIPLNNLKIKTIDKQLTNSLITSITIFQRLLPIFAIGLFLIMLILVPIGSFIINTIYILIASLIAYGVFRIFIKRQPSFKKTLQISFHAITLPLIIDYFLIITKPTIYTNNGNIPKIPVALPLLFLILLSVFVFGGIYEAHYRHIKKV